MLCYICILHYITCVYYTILPMHTILHVYTTLYIHRLLVYLPARHGRDQGGGGGLRGLGLERGRACG